MLVLMPSRRRQRALTEVRVRSWDEFVAGVADGPYADWAFRGQADASWSLETSLGRYLRRFAVDRSAWRAQEERSLRIFKRKAPNLLAAPPAREDHFQWLALMEHHGAPTRLLDCTWSPFVAAFFALEQATGDSAVWALDPRRLNQRACVVCRQPPARLDPRVPGNLMRRFYDARHSFVWIGEPDLMNRRLVAQSGTFLVPSAVDRTIDEILLDDRATRGAIARIVLPAAVRDRAMRQLYSMNITLATLFPDLDGLARSLAFELEFHWGFDPRHPRRRAMRAAHDGSDAAAGDGRDARLKG